jgi:transcriptional regulator with XRE-family HTH domain
LFALGIKNKGNKTMIYPNPKQLADRLRKARESAGLSIEDVGALLAPRYVGTKAMALKSGIEEIESIEAGKEDVGRLLLIYLARMYGCSVSQLVSDPIDLNGLTPIEAFNRDLITEGRLAELLGVSRLEARGMVLEAGQAHA